MNRAVLHLGPAGARTIPRPEPANSYGCVEDAAGRLWIPALDKGLFVLDRGRWRVWPGTGGTGAQPANAARAADGRAVIQFRAGPKPPAAAPFIAVAGVPGFGRSVESVLPGRAALFVGGAQGLARLTAGGWRRLPAARCPALSSVNGLVQTAGGETWTIGDAGVLRMRTALLDRALRRPGAPLPIRLFDFRDGLNSFSQKIPGMQAVAGGDGRLWFLTRRGVLSVDPAALTRNPLPPPVLIRSLAANGRRWRDPVDMTLPAGTTSLTVGYTANSLAMPSRVRFRCRLEGAEPGWADCGGRRERSFVDLHPGTFRFRVVAANADGVWNTRGATLRIVIPPTLVETWSFRVLCILAALALGYALYSLRVRQIAAIICAVMDERQAERERIARELHDTLLQGIQGLMMRFQAASYLIADGHPAKPVIETAMDRAEDVLVEGRERVLDLRAPDTRPLDVLLEELAREQPFPPDTKIEVVTDGAPRPIEPLVVEDVVRVAREALFNAARHAQPRAVRMAIRYARARLEVTIRDDGAGFDPAAVAQAVRHFGLLGMRERARRMGAALTIDSAPGAGTRVAIAVPALLACRLARRPAWWRRRAPAAAPGGGG